MTAHWKPGDLAMIQRDGREFMVVRVACPCPRMDMDTMHYDESNARPLVVINPEDREQVNAILADYDHHRGARSTQPFAVRAEALQAALRSLVAPPKPEEPTGLAVRVFADGSEWARVGPWWVCADLGEVPRCWDYLTERDDFRILSSSVTQ